jgi:tetratricopeptide (TPR) repeat protein
MTWGLDRATLQAGRDEMAELVAEEASHYRLEQLARAHRWLGEDDEARRRFREAAEDLEASIETPGRGDAWSRGRTGGFLRLAGDDDGARAWFQRALDSGPIASVDEAALLYLLSDPVAAEEATRRADERFPLLDAMEALARARVGRDPEAANEARDALAGAIRAERLPPHQTSGAPHLTLWDWLEEAFRVEAELGGAPVPDHAAMLERAGLAAAPKKRSRRKTPDWPPPPGRHAVPRRTPDGAEVEPVVTVDEDGDIDLLVDPRPELRVRLIKQYGQFLVRITWGGDVEEDLAHPYEGFRAACEAAADWLAAYAPDPPGGPWAADTVRALADAAFAD